jgi:hypothetical protein
MNFTAEQGGKLGEAIGIGIRALMAIPGGLEAIASEISSCDTRLDHIRLEIEEWAGFFGKRLEAIDQELANIRQQLEDNN